MRFVFACMSLGVCLVSINGCFTVAADDDSSAGQAGQSGQDASGGSNSTGGTGGGTGGGMTGGSNSTGGTSTGGTGGAQGGTMGNAGSGSVLRAGRNSGTAGHVSAGGSAGKPSSGGAGGKGGTGGSTPVDPGTCQGYSNKLETCNVIDGPIDCSVAASTDLVACLYGCFEAADCDAITEYDCFGTTNAVSDCLTSCQSFTCGDGLLIPSYYQCDDFEDCTGGEDEKNCPTCGDGTSVPPSYLCDGTSDCSDGSDEGDCPVQPMFECGSGESIPGGYRCDGSYVDCTDGSDEEGCALLTCPVPDVPTPGAACGQAEETLSSCGLLPGGVMTSCADRTPYAACQKGCYASASCDALNGFFCGLGADTGDSIYTCISECESLSDELPCTSGGDSVPSDWICDGVDDCSDASDEAGCVFSCGAAGETVPVYSLCDGYTDCADGSDEEGCGPTCATDAGQP